MAIRSTNPSLRESSLAPAREPSPTHFFLAVYVLLVIYATLYPLIGWRAPGGSAFAFLTAPWPRYLTAFDLAVNFFGYVPFGLLCVLAVQARSSGGTALVFAIVSGAVLSLLLESTQSFLPARVSSNVDLFANVAGAAVGGLVAAILARWRPGGGPLRRWRAQALTPGAAADLGLALLGLWLFAQLNPATLLFGSGDLRDLFVSAVGERHEAELFVSIEATITAVNLVVVALLASAAVRPEVSIPGLVVALVVVALGVKTFAFAILMRAEHVFAWLTPGAQLGLVGGAVLALAVLWLPYAVRLTLAAMLVMVATVLVNLAPPNPYLSATLKVWEQGHFLNFNGLTRLVSAAWPFAALGYLVYLSAAPRRKPLR
ncbi:MAG: VanZ family protein [Betaproteobacteria bacterium]|nr:VanZ family protein [Betaproteobacteria bacterium]